MDDRIVGEKILEELKKVRTVLAEFISPLQDMTRLPHYTSSEKTFAEDMREGKEKQDNKKIAEDMLQETRLQNQALFKQNKILFWTFIITAILGVAALLVNSYFQYQDSRSRNVYIENLELDSYV